MTLVVYKLAFYVTSLYNIIKDAKFSKGKFFCQCDSYSDVTGFLVINAIRSYEMILTDKRNIPRNQNIHPFKRERQLDSIK